MRERRRPWSGSPATWLAAAAGLVLVVGLAGWNVVLRADAQTKREAIARRDTMFRCFQSVGTAKARLVSSDDARALACIGDGTANLVTTDLDENDAARNVYVLWWQDATTHMHAAGTFDVTRGVGFYAMPLPVAPSDVRAFAISLEPGRTAPATPSSSVAFGLVMP